MYAKLQASQLILEGLVTENFVMIADGAGKLEQLSQAEEWRISNDAMYRQHSAQFQRIVKQLSKSAKEKNLDRAALTWLEATMSCIECHRFVRAVLIAEEKPAALDFRKVSELVAEIRSIEQRQVYGDGSKDQL